MKLLLFVLVSSFSYSDYLNTASSNQCVYNVYPYQKNTGLCYTRRTDNREFCSKSLDHDDLLNGYVLINGECLLSNDLQVTGLTEEEFNYLLALLAHVMGATTLFLVSYLSIMIAKGR